MSSSEFVADAEAILVADASIIINLNASGLARRIIDGISAKIVVSSNARIVLEIGARLGHDDARQLDALIAEGSIEEIELGSAALGIYESLIDASLGMTLDDGEAATIALALERGAIALLDDKKARRLCGAHFRSLTLGCSAQFFLDATGIDRSTRATAMTDALQKGGMRVPPAFVDAVVQLIGDDVAAECRSLPRGSRISRNE